MHILAFDVGGTKLEATLCSLKDSASDSATRLNFSPGRTLWLSTGPRHRLPTERLGGYPQILAKLAELARTVCTEQGLTPKDLSAVGMALPGTVDPASQTMTIGNALVLAGHSIAQDLKKELSISAPVFCDNDANLFALAEVLAGAGVEHERRHGVPVHAQIGVGIILGTGCGAGVIVQGRPLSGRRGAFGEVGHTVLYAHGLPCFCGRDGCAEQYLSGPALEGAFSARKYSQVAHVGSAKDIFALANARDPIATGVVLRYKRDLETFLVNLSNTFDPDFFVLGGGMSQQDILYQGMAEAVGARNFVRHPIPVYRNVHGDSAGILGAALLAATCTEAP